MSEPELTESSIVNEPIKKKSIPTTFTAISDDNFRQLLVNISCWYDERGYINMLKVLYKGHVKDICRLNEASNMMDLLHLLIASGNLSSTNLTLLYDTIEVTKAFDLQQEIKDKFPSYPREIVISKFSPYRQKLIKLGLALTQDDNVAKISSLYRETKFKKYADSWSLIMDLEHNMIIHEGDMNRFIETLKTYRLHTALKAVAVELTESSIVNEPIKKKSIPTTFTAKVLTCAVAIVIISTGIIFYTDNSFGPSLFLSKLSMVLHSQTLKKVDDEQVVSQMEGNKSPDESISTALLLWAEEVDTGNPSQPGAKIQTLPADPTTYAPDLIDTGNIRIHFKFEMIPGKIVALDTDYQDDIVFFSANLRMAINRGPINNTIASKVIGGTSKRVNGIAVDWLANTLYIIDQTYNWIVLISHREPNKYVILVRDGLDKPCDVAVHPAKGFLFWSDCGKVPKIERANLDGTNRTSLITTDITSPNGLSVDYLDNRLYWTDVDDMFSKVESCELDGANRQVLLRERSFKSHFYKLKVHKGYVYITDWKRKLLCVHKASGEVYFHLNLQSRPHGVTVYGDGNQKIQLSPCLSNPCSEICTSAKNGYKCVCRDSFHLLSDGKTCQKNDDFFSTPQFLFSNQTSIVKLPSNFPNASYPNDFAVDGILNNQYSVVALQADVARHLLFFSDTLTRSVFSLELKNEGERKLVAGYLGLVQGIAVDYLSQTLYWTDTVNNHIMVSSYDGRYRQVLIDSAIVEPLSIAVDPIRWWMFWLELGSQSHIERARLDGSDRKIIVNTQLDAASGITIDFESQRLYFADRSSGAIQSVDYDGEARKVAYVKAGALYFDMDIFQDFLVWTEWPPNNGMHLLNRETGEFVRSLPFHGKAFGITTLDATRQPNGTSPCMINNGGCEQICIPGSGASTTCLCSVGYTLGEDGECNNNIVEDNFLLVADSELKTIFQIDLSNGRDYAYTALRMGPLQNPVAVGFDPVDRHVYVSDVEAHQILRSSLVGNNTIVIHRDAYDPCGLAVDHINRLLFWTDGTNGTIHVSKLNGTNSKILISADLDIPRAIAVDPVKGFLFWTDAGVNAKIERSQLDGTNRRIIVDTNLAWPNGLAIDTKDQFIYWCDVWTNNIEKVKFDGSQRTLMKHLDDHVYRLVIDDLYIYFTYWNGERLMRMNKVEGAKPVAVGEGAFGRLSALTASFNSRQTGKVMDEF